MQPVFNAPKVMAIASLIAVLSPPASQAKTIFHHSGGAINVVLKEVERLEERKRPVRIAGECHSACTLFLATNKVCVTNEARLKFHQAQRGFGLRLFAKPHRFGTAKLLANYPVKWRRWIATEGGLPWYGWLTITGKQAVEKGLVKPC